MDPITNDLIRASELYTEGRKQLRRGLIMLGVGIVLVIIGVWML